MDTRFWGPSGWKLFHLITFDYKYSMKNAKLYATFFETIPYILPCKFCRASLTDYYRQHPFLLDDSLNPSLNSSLNPSLNPKLNIKKWMFDIHNCVNDKLRKQGLNPNPNPKYGDIVKYYKKWMKCDWTQHLSIVWDFLFAVAYNHPKETSRESKPMPECPIEVYKCNDTCEKNKWNVLSLSERMKWFNCFWLYLPAVLPKEVAKKWKEVEINNPPTLSCRQSSLAWLWRMRCGLDSTFKDPYSSICKKIASYSSDCGKKKNTITCRKKKRVNKLRKTLKQ